MTIGQLCTTELLSSSPPGLFPFGPYGTLRFAVFDFYHNLNHFYGVLTDFCTLQNCPTMCAGPT
jgi:hypothetical protein